MRWDNPGVHLLYMPSWVRGSILGGVLWGKKYEKGKEKRGGNFIRKRKGEKIKGEIKLKE